MNEETAVPTPGTDGGAATTPLKILVVDDANTNAVMLKSLLSKQGHGIVVARDGLEAITAFLREDPDLILMDVMMPNMDGIEASRHIRDISEIVPIIFLSAADDEKLVEQGLRIGSDYITKPVKLPQLNQKLNAHFRSVLAYREVVARKEEVQLLHEALLEENRVAAHVLSRMLSRMQPPGDHLQYNVIPSGMFSGDIVLAGTTPSGRLNVLLADAIGHGLPAAFSLMPIIPAFDAMTRKGFPLEDILFEINRTLRTVMPVHRFIAATAVSADLESGRCDVWVGGNPPLAILSEDGVSHVESSHLALGLADIDDKAEFVCESIRLQGGERLVFASDGLMETWDAHIQASEGSFGGFIAAGPAEDVFERILDTVRRYRQHDDASLVVMHMAKPKSVADEVVERIARHEYSRIELDLDVPQLRKPDVLHTITDLAHRLGLVAAEDGLFGMVLAELFANAFEHGVLGLPSEIKYSGEDGMERFMHLRERKVAELGHGHIKIEIEATEFSGVPATRLRIVDSGPGFDQALLLSEGDFAHAAAAGRGFKLVMNTCLKISYAGTGNDVTAYIPSRA